MTHTSVASEMLRGFVRGLPLICGCLPLGFILGVQASQHDMSVLTTVLMTGLNFAGGSEFAAVALWSAAPPVLVVIFSTWLINSRHIVLGASLALHTRRLSPMQNALVFFFMCDEVWALTSADITERRRAGVKAENLFSFPFHIGMGLGFWTLWMASAGAGAALGQSIGDMTKWGFMMAFPAIFASLIVMMWPGFRRALPIVLAALASAVASLFVPSHWCVLAGTVTGLVAVMLGLDDLDGLFGRKKAEVEAEAAAPKVAAPTEHCEH